jgi:hypothetical protein
LWLVHLGTQTWEQTCPFVVVPLDHKVTCILPAVVAWPCRWVDLLSCSTICWNLWGGRCTTEGSSRGSPALPLRPTAKIVPNVSLLRIIIEPPWIWPEVAETQPPLCVDHAEGGWQGPLVRRLVAALRQAMLSALGRPPRWDPHERVTQKGIKHNQQRIKPYACYLLQCNLDYDSKGVFGTTLLPFFQLRSTNSTMEQLHRGVRGAGATP